MKGKPGVRHSFMIKDILRSRKLLLLVVAAGMVLFYVCLSARSVPAALTVTRKSTTFVAKRPAEPCQSNHDAGFLTAIASKLVDASGCRVYLTGVNWFGFETSSFAPHGLGVRNWQAMLKQMAQLGFNTLRLPFSDQLFDPSSVPQGINYRLNPDLRGLHGLALMDKIIEGARKAGLRVILDHHDASADERSAFWYDAAYPQSRWIDDWVMLARHYRGNDTVIGADLDNEPHYPATWGDDNPYTDWRLAAEQAGDAILAVNRDWLIIVQGIDLYQGDSYWWGGNLEGAAKHPVVLSIRDKLVYSAHDYGPSVYDEQWFKVSSPAVLTQTLPALWDRHWGYLQKDGIAPLFVGEFGGPSMGGDLEGVWQRTLISYLHTQGISYAYWAWNADSGDTGGILQSDWKTVNQGKMSALSAYQWPLLGQP
ncbi:MAG TPA: glycoside hydrolase family 5 protein [Ktedonobacteraceae bacterium]|nr:glycoside hydrolase family 5 protein [Ktedonobacteraceae bacterium]